LAASNKKNKNNYMLHNLKIEWLKIKNYRVFQVFSILYLIGIIGVIFIFYKVYINLMGNIAEQASGGKIKEGSDIFLLFSPENIWKTVCYATSFLLYLPGMIIISLFINEVNFKTHRQNIIDGWKRETFIISKISLIICFAIVIAMMNIIAVAIMCNITNTPFSFKGSEVIMLSFLQTITYLLFALTLATLFRKSGVAIIIYFIYGLILENIFSFLLNRWTSPAGYFLPLQVSDSLIPMPGARKLYINLPDQYVIIAGTLLMCGLYLFFTIRKYRYDDL
jgi:hypothetical protein